MLKDFITTQKALKNSVEEKLDKLESLSLKVENKKKFGTANKAQERI